MEIRIAYGVNKSMSDAAGNDDYDATVFRRPLRPAARSALESYVVLQVARVASRPAHAHVSRRNVNFGGYVL